jgi:putative ABC transport system ATP-binding protein
MKIKISNLKKSYLEPERELTILSDVNLEINSGEVVALLGKSGSGKTTMLSMLSGLEKPTTGEIIVDGEDITKLSEQALCLWRAKSLGIVFQQFHLVPHLTALENVMLPLEIMETKLSIIDEAKKWLSFVGLDDRIGHYTNKLSGGEQQRVAIARALAKAPKLILADEPTGNLDNETGQIIIKLLFEMVRKNNLTMVLVTHDEDLAKLCDRTIRLVGGKCFS